MAETLLTPSGIKMFGRVMSSLQYYDDTAAVGYNNFLRKQLAAAPKEMTVAGKILPNRVVELTGKLDSISVGMVVTAIDSAGKTQVFPPGTHIVSVTPSAGGKATFTVSADPLEPTSIPKSGLSLSLAVWDLGVYLARIYAFSFEGGTYSMPKPAIFVVHGIGKCIDASLFRGGKSSVDQGGVAAKDWEFAGDADLRYWEYDKGDFSLRLDTEAGPFEQILLQASLRAGAADRSGAGLEIRSGAGVSGAGVSGAGVSGAGVSGAGVSGAGVSGAGLRR
jgi:hypothetical protein